MDRMLHGPEGRIERGVLHVLAETIAQATARPTGRPQSRQGREKPEQTDARAGACGKTKRG